MVVYASVISGRLKYICDFIGKEITGSPFELTSNKAEFISGPRPRINYSDDRISPSDLWIQPQTLLFEKGIREQVVKCFDLQGTPYFFKTEGDLHFDIFSACFYLLSRYEEYLPHHKDSYGRFAHEDSLAFKARFLNIPLVNIWLNQFREKLKKRYPALETKQPSFRFVPTYDIDEAYSYKYKQWWRSAGGAIRDILQGKLNRVNHRKNVLFNKEEDPFNSYEWMDLLHSRHQLSPHYFFLVAEKTSKYDKNIPPSDKAMQELIRKHSEKYALGIHPSWQSHDHLEKIQSEIKCLEEASRKKITTSRQHYIRMQLPQTYRRLIQAGIREDYSMGYGSINGFRASVASPYFWYDLEQETATELLLYPFCYMEANSFFEQKFSSEQALEELRHYHKVVSEVNGTLITIWHNTFLGTDEMFTGWREVYQQFVSEVLG